MTRFDMRRTWRIAAAAAAAAAGLAACNSDNNGSAPVASVAPEYTQFSTFTEQVFAAAPNSTPVAVNGVNFAFDVNYDPTAFDGLIM